MIDCFPTPDGFARLASRGDLVPMGRRLFSDALTPVLAYRRLVRPDDRLAPSFLFESVVGGDRVGRYSFLGSHPIAEIVAYDTTVHHRDHLDPRRSRTYSVPDPLAEMRKITDPWRLALGPELPTDLPRFTGGWVGYAGYDTVRYLEREALDAARPGVAGPPPDDRHLPDLHFQLYNDVVAFDHARKTLLVITHVRVDQHPSLQAAYHAGRQQLDALTQRIVCPTWDAQPPGVRVRGGHIDLSAPPPSLPVSSLGPGGYQNAVRKIQEYIRAGDAFQVVPSQRFELLTTADPFDIYRALRVVNPSPYMFYLQIEGGMLVGSSPEILCRVENGLVTNRPLAGTRRRGDGDREDRALEAELLADPKERAEHIMLVDLGRNDVGRVARPGSIRIPDVMVVERYSHVMHISSTVTGRLAEGLSAWDALRVTLPVGTVSGAPKVRAMQIIDEVEKTRRGPYAGAVGYVDFAGNMDTAIALRTLVALPAPGATASAVTAPTDPNAPRPTWRIHLQAGGGIVADSDPDAEHQETVNKAAALAKAVDVAQRVFADG